MNKILLSVLFLCVWHIECSAQVVTAAQYVRKATADFENKNYNEALEYYRIVLTDDPDRTDLMYNAGESALQTRHYAAANLYFDNLSRVAKAKEYPDLNYKRGLTKKALEEYDLAISLFEKYATENANGPYAQAAKTEIETCEWAKTIVFADKTYEVKHLDRNVNTPYIDAAPMQYGSTLYYTSGYQPDSTKSPVAHVFSTDMVKKGLPLSINSQKEGEHTASYALNTNRDVLYYTICTENDNTTFNCAIYRRSKLGEDDWSIPIQLDSSVNHPGFTSTQPAVGYDSTRHTDVLFYASNKPGTKGGMDIWMADISADGKVGKSIPVEDLNTTKDEVTPYFHTPTQTLFFSTDGYKSLGGLDIYSSVRTPNGWFKAENAGYPLNSSYDDTYYSLAKAKAFFVSNRKGGVCESADKDCICNDIYSYDLKVDLKAETFLAGMSNKLDSVRLDLLDVESNTLVSNQVNNTGNDFYFPLEYDRKYKIIATKRGFIPDSVAFNTLNLTTSITLRKSLELRPNAKLIVYVFDSLERKPLNDATVFLRDAKGKLVSQKLAAGTNTVVFTDILYGSTYNLNGELRDYEGDTSSVAIDAMSVNPKFEYYDTLYLYPFGGLPLTLYFDNDEPLPKSRATATLLTYDETVNSYFEDQPEYLRYTYDKTNPEEAVAKSNAINRFFQDSVRLGYEHLQYFSKTLEKYLGSGHALEVVMQGYASPIAQNDYNRLLTMRRVSSVINHFKAFNGGTLLNYMKTGQLRVRVEPYGEDRVSGPVSDDQKNRRLSVYSIEAMRERKVEILEINRFFLDKNVAYDPNASMLNLFTLQSNGSFQTQTKGINTNVSTNLITSVRTKSPEEVIKQAMEVVLMDSYTGRIISGSTPIEIYDQNSRAKIGEARRSGNTFTYTVDKGKEYVLKSTSLGYSDVSLSAPAPNNVSTEVIHDTLYLTPFAGLPLSLYFDNDKPNSTQSGGVTGYDKTYRDFYAKKSEFIRIYNKMMASAGADATVSKQEMELFFDSELRGGYSKLNGFCEALKSYLQNGNAIEIILEGYASPVSDGEYNKRLAERRIKSVRAHFTSFQNGILRPYINSGKLKITEEPIGAQGNAFDARTDASVYSIDASLNRRVVIKDIILNGTVEYKNKK